MISLNYDGAVSRESRVERGSVVKIPLELINGHKFGAQPKVHESFMISVCGWVTESKQLEYTHMKTIITSQDR